MRSCAAIGGERPGIILYLATLVVSFHLEKIISSVGFLPFNSAAIYCADTVCLIPHEIQKGCIKTMETT